MAGLWVVTGVAFAVALAAWLAARRASARLSKLSDMYWELNYQHIELRKRVERLPGAEPPADPATPPPPSNESFIPLRSLRR